MSSITSSWSPALNAKDAITLAVRHGILPQPDSVPGLDARLGPIARHLDNVLEPMERILLLIVGKLLPPKADIIRVMPDDDRLTAIVFTDRRVIKLVPAQKSLEEVGYDYIVESIYLAGVLGVLARQNTVDVHFMLAYRNARVELLKPDAGDVFPAAYRWCRDQADALAVNIRSHLPALGKPRHMGEYPLHLRVKPVYQGDILNMPTELIPDLIVHQTNCKGVMGAGLARQIRSRWPKVYEEYHRFCQREETLLGQMLACQAYPGGPVICNCFGQEGYGTDKRYTDYGALKNALICVKELAVVMAKTVPGMKGHANVAIPYGIGCGLAGGDWQVVSEIINCVFRECDENVVSTYLCQYN